MSQSSNSTNFILKPEEMVTIPAKGSYKIITNSSTYYCTTCDNLGAITSIENGRHTYTPCPDCINRKKGIPIPHTEIGVD